MQKFFRAGMVPAISVCKTWFSIISFYKVFPPFYYNIFILAAKLNIWTKFLENMLSYFCTLFASISGAKFTNQPRPTGVFMILAAVNFVFIFLLLYLTLILIFGACSLGGCKPEYLNHIGVIFPSTFPKNYWFFPPPFYYNFYFSC